MSITAIALCALGMMNAQGNPTIATVNGEVLTDQNYHRRMEYLTGLGRQTNTGQFIEIMPAIATLDTLVTEMLLLQIAKTKGLIPSETEIDQELSYRIKKSPSFVANWQAVGRTMPELRYMLKVDRAQFKVQTEGIVITETDIQQNYNAAKATRFTSKPKVKLRVIVVHDEDTKKKVETGLKGGTSFESMASAYSTDPSKSIGGDFGIVDTDALGPDLQAAIKTLKKGERTPWLGKDGVFALFQVDTQYPAAVIPLDPNLKEDLRRELMVIKGSTRIDLPKLLREARGAASISITSPEVDKAYKQFVDLEKKSKSGG